MRLKLPAAAVIILILPLCAAFAIPVTSINQLISFGDSLSDNGNVSIATAGVLPGPNYAPGMYTDGPNTNPPTTGPFGLWIDQLAPKLGVADPAPFLAGGTNYAFAGADTGHNPSFPAPLAVPFISDQLGFFNTTHPSGAPASALYTFWAGANDIADQKNPVTAADNIYNNILTLSGEGGKYFMWLNLPPLGDTPNGLASGQSALINAASNAFDAEWAVDLSKLQSQGIQVVGVNIDTLFNQIAGNPAAYGFTDVTDPAQGKTGANPNNYVFWDGMHPTTAVDAVVANLAFNDFVATPEPANLGLALLGSIFLIFLGLRTRRERVRS